MRGLLRPFRLARATPRDPSQRVHRHLARESQGKARIHREGARGVQGEAEGMSQDWPGHREAVLADHQGEVSRVVEKAARWGQEGAEPA